MSVSFLDQDFMFFPVVHLFLSNIMHMETVLAFNLHFLRIGLNFNEKQVRFAKVDSFGLETETTFRFYIYFAFVHDFCL